jgi:hypothetical protein
MMNKEECPDEDYEIKKQTSYDVLKLEQIDSNPFCHHGPTVLFTDSKKEFYSCSACRDKKLCQFYFKLEENGKKSIPESKMNEWKQRYMIAQQNYFIMREK